MSTPEKSKTLKRTSTMTKTAEDGEEFLHAVGHEKSDSNQRETRGTKRTQEVIDDLLSNKKYKPVELNEEETHSLVNQLRMTFRLFDLNNDEFIDREELSAVMRSLGERPTKQKINKIMDQVDTDKNGYISELEFLKYMLKRRNIKLSLTPELREQKEKQRIAKLRKLREKEKYRRSRESKEREKKALLKRLAELNREIADSEESEEERKKASKTTATTTSTKKEKEKDTESPPPLTRGHSITDFYTEFAGLHEIPTTEVDAHSNPIGRKYDLGKEGAFSIFTIVVGLFCDFNMKEPEFRKNAGKALEDKGFIVEVITSERKFIQRLEHIDVSSAWIISGDKSEIFQDEFGRAIKAFHESGRGIAIWADNHPWLHHASIATQYLCKVKLEGDTPGDKNLKLGDETKPGFFKKHLLTSGIKQLYEGVTICYPQDTDGLQLLATSTNGKACMAYVDFDSLHPNYGRIVLDCGFTKLYHHWDSAGTGRYVRNVAVWLLGLEHRIKMGYPLSGPIA